MFGTLLRAFMGDGATRRVPAGCHRELRFRPKVRAFEDRVLPSTIGWLGTTSSAWGLPANWSPAQVPGSADTAEFGITVNGTLENNPCEVAANATVSNLQMQAGYTAQLKIDAGVTLQSATGFTFAPTTANVYFAATSSTLQANGGGSNLSNFTFSGAFGTVVIKSGATLSVACTAASTSTAQFEIYGTLNVANSATLTFQGSAGIEINSGAGMQLAQENDVTELSLGTGTGILQIDSGGSLTYTGATGTTTRCDLPLLNNGTCTFTSGGFLYFGQNTLQTHNSGVDMESGSISLNGGITLECSGGYYQDAGALSTNSNATTILMVGTNAEAQVNGGTITLGGASYGTLTVSGGWFDMNGGTFNAKINGSSTAQCDKLIDSTGFLVGGTSTLAVSVVGTLTVPKGAKNLWVLLSGPSANTAVWGTFNPPTGITVPATQPNAEFCVTPS